MRYKLWRSELGGECVGEFDTLEDAHEYAAYLMQPVQVVKKGGNVIFKPPFLYIAVPVDGPGTEPA